MAGRKQWQIAFTSANGGTALTTKPTLVGGYGGQLLSKKTLGSFRLTDSLGGTQKIAYSKCMGTQSRAAATLGGFEWINLAHPALFSNGLTISIGGAGVETICGQVLYKEI